MSWPTKEDYDETVDYDLEDPKTIGREEVAKWKTVTCPTEIEYYLRLRNRRHFGQAEGTPFTLPEMKKKFNWEADTAQAELVLKGKYTDTELDEITQMLLDNMKRALPANENDEWITKEQFIGKVKAWRESTSTSPPGSL